MIQIVVDTHAPTHISCSRTYMLTQSMRQGKVEQLRPKTTLFFSREKEELPQAGFKPATYMYKCVHVHAHVVFQVCTLQMARRCICVHTHTDYAQYVRATERAIHTIHVHVLPAIHVHENHNSLGRELPLGLDVKQSPDAQDAFRPIPGLISRAGVTGSVGITRHARLSS